MEIRCKSTKRFLCKIDIENYLKDLEKLGIIVSIPLIIEIPCRACRTIEVYEIYKNRYKYIRSYKKYWTNITYVI